MRPPPRWLWMVLALGFAAELLFGIIHAFPAEYPRGLFENSSEQPDSNCDFQGQCYKAHPGGTAPAPSVTKPNPFPFDTRSTTRTDCDATGCPPAGRLPAEAPELETPPAPPAAEAAPGPYLAAPAPESPQRPNPACLGAAQRLYPTMEAVFAAHRLCDWGAR